MAVTLTVEDGTGVTSANSYVSLADATAYFSNDRLHEAAWAAAVDDDDRSRALIMASRLIDQQVLTRYGGFQGTRMKATQGLAWPRGYCPDPDPINPALDPTFAWVYAIDNPQYLSATAVPARVKNATYETALALLVGDRTLDPGGQGLNSLQVGSIALSFDKSGREKQYPLPDVVADILAPLTLWSSGDAAAVCVRVA